MYICMYVSMHVCTHECMYDYDYDYDCKSGLRLKACTPVQLHYTQTKLAALITIMYIKNINYI